MMEPGFSHSPRSGLPVAIFALAGFLFLLAPIIAILPLSLNSSGFLSYPMQGLSLRWYVEVLTEPQWTAALWNSLRLAAATALVATLLGTLAAYACHPRAGSATSPRLALLRSVMRALALGPMIVPVVILALGLFMALSWLGLGSGFAGLLIGHTLVAAPVVFVTVYASMESYNRNLHLAARSLGAPPVGAARDGILPQIRPGVLGGAVLAFATSFDETVITLFVAPPGYMTLPRHLFATLRDRLDSSIVAVATILIAVTMLAFLLAEILRRAAQGPAAR
jgi:putative spermidine/putrescine transport system permease protein